MIRSFTLWLKKRKLRKAYAEDLKTLLVRNFFGDTDIENEAPALEALYLSQGLTEEDLDDVRKNLGPLRVE